MKEFWLWMIIVTLLIACIMALSMVAMHIEKRLNKADAIILRLEEKERKNAKSRTDPKSDTD
jgi:predicted lysophospholipase L1 biosynthesis ABC-type transport system permease subunit